MRQTQINGETFVHCGDVVAWLRVCATSCREAEADAMARGIELIAGEMEVWDNDPERKRGVPDLKMDVIDS